MEKKLRERLSLFVVDVLLLQRTIVFTSIAIQYVKEQLIEATLRCENNYVSAPQAGDKTAVETCLSDTQTAHYWLRILREAMIGDSTQINLLVKEAMRLKEDFARLAKASGKRLIPSQSVAAQSQKLIEFGYWNLLQVIFLPIEALFEDQPSFCQWQKESSAM